MEENRGTEMRSMEDALAATQATDIQVTEKLCQLKELDGEKPKIWCEDFGSEGVSSCFS